MSLLEFRVLFVPFLVLLFDSYTLQSFCSKWCVMSSVANCLANDSVRIVFCIGENVCDEMSDFNFTSSNRKHFQQSIGMNEMNEIWFEIISLQKYLRIVNYDSLLPNILSFVQTKMVKTIWRLFFFSFEIWKMPMGKIRIASTTSK